MIKNFAWILCILLVSCQETDQTTLFEKYFEPYIDLSSGQERTKRNKDLLDGMAHYNKGEYESALPLLESHSKGQQNQAITYFYMGICYMALDQSDRAELMFDRVDNILPNGFIDQSQWYTALCLLRSGQTERCIVDLNKILEKSSHAYREEATALLEDLNSDDL